MSSSPTTGTNSNCECSDELRADGAYPNPCKARCLAKFPGSSRNVTISSGLTVLPAEHSVLRAISHFAAVLCLKCFRQGGRTGGEGGNYEQRDLRFGLPRGGHSHGAWFAFRHAFDPLFRCQATLMAAGADRLCRFEQPLQGKRFPKRYPV